MERNEAITRIKAALRKRSGKPWSVTGGRGTSWGWVTIDAPPRRRCYEWDGAECEPGRGYMSHAERAELAQLLGLDRPVHHQGECIPSGSCYREEYVDRAEGRTPARCGEQYWD